MEESVTDVLKDDFRGWWLFWFWFILNFGEEGNGTGGWERMLD